MNDSLSWWEKLPLALATTAQSVVVGFWYYRYIDLGLWHLNIAIAVIAGLALDAIVVTTIMGRRVGRDSAWSMGASFGAFLCSALIAVDSYSTWLAFIRPLLHVSYPAMVLLYSQHLATARSTSPQPAEQPATVTTSPAREVAPKVVPVVPVLAEDTGDPLPELKRIAGRLRSKGASWKVIADQVGRSPSTVRDWLAPTTTNGREH